MLKPETLKQMTVTILDLAGKKWGMSQKFETDSLAIFRNIPPADDVIGKTTIMVKLDGKMVMSWMDDKMIQLDTRTEWQIALSMAYNDLTTDLTTTAETTD